MKILPIIGTIIFIACHYRVANFDDSKAYRIGYVENDIWTWYILGHDSTAIQLFTSDTISCRVIIDKWNQNIPENRMFINEKLNFPFIDTLVFSLANCIQERDQFGSRYVKPQKYLRTITNANGFSKISYRFECSLYEIWISDKKDVIHYIMEGTDTTLFNEAKKSIEIIETPLK
jgi:hypothetical protein